MSLPAASDNGSGARRLRIVFFIRHLIYTRNFESTLRALAGRGHRVHVSLDHLLTETPGTPLAEELIVRLAGEYPNLTYGPGPGREDEYEVWTDGWAQLERHVSLWRDYLRYFEPRYSDAPKLRKRAATKAGRGLETLVRLPFVRTDRGRATLARLLAWLEQSLPPRPAVERYLAEHEPDIALVTPLVDLGSPQAGYVRAARRADVPTGLLVHSWDNLTNKGLIHEPPDLVTVWNEIQHDEAVEMHGVPAERVAVTGAPGYDHWFDWAPSRDREEFCATVGLPAERPFLLYLCSSYFIAPREVEFVDRWLERVRSFPGLEDVGVLIRPHPKSTEQWEGADLAGHGAVAVWPPLGANPLDPRAKADYFDSLFHSAAVVGVNTSALIESAIVGRPVHTLLAPEFRDTQEGTLHFHYLSDEQSGVLRVARSFEEHLAQLAGAVSGDSGADERLRRFVRAFVRPNGLDVAATPLLADAVERTASAPARAGAELGPTLPRWVLAPAAFALSVLYGRYSPAPELADPEAPLPSIPRRILRALPGLARAAVGRDPRSRRGPAGLATAGAVEPAPPDAVEVEAQTGAPDPDGSAEPVRSPARG